MSKQKKPSTIVTALKRMLGIKTAELNFMEEEALQSPGRVAARNFFSKPTATFGLVVFLIIFVFVLVGPIFMPIDLGYTDASLTNIGPGYNMMKVDKQLQKEGIVDLVAGPTYGMGVSKSGSVYVWGHTRVSNTIDIKNLPEEIANNTVDVVNMAAGTDHVVALTSENELIFWGNDRLGQARYESNSELFQKIRTGNINVKQLEAGNQFSAILTEEGDLYLWGNASTNDLDVRNKERMPEGQESEARKYQGNIDKIALTDHAYIALLKDGTVAYCGNNKDTPLYKHIPECLIDGSSEIVDIAAGSQSAAALTADGQVYVWGVATHGEKDVPATDSKMVKLYGGRYHYTGILEDGSVVSWGDDMYGQATAPNSAQNITAVFAGGNQNYALTADGEVITWGLKGFLCGTDDLGRDVLTRIVNGGKTTMTVGAISVIISTIIGVLLGGLAGYFGGKVDMGLSRIAEVIASLPFLPFALILTAIIPRDISVEQRMYIIMVVLGVLSWTGTFRLVRAQIFSQREQEYVTAAKSLGVTEGSILAKHIIPNVMSVLLVSVTLNFATCMLTESSLSYLGFGIPAPAPTWGNMLNGCNDSVVIQQYWWRWVFPSIIFGLTTICINLMGDGLRDALDPKSNGR